MRRSGTRNRQEMLWKCSFIIVFTFTDARRLSNARVCGFFMIRANIYTEYLDISTLNI